MNFPKYSFVFILVQAAVDVATNIQGVIKKFRDKTNKPIIWLDNNSFTRFPTQNNACGVHLKTVYAMLLTLLQKVPLGGFRQTRRA